MSFPLRQHLNYRLTRLEDQSKMTCCVEKGEVASRRWDEIVTSLSSIDPDQRKGSLPGKGIDSSNDPQKRPECSPIVRVAFYCLCSSKLLLHVEILQ